MKRRRGVRPISAKRLAYLEELQRQLPELYARCGGICEVCQSAPVAHLTTNSDVLRAARTLLQTYWRFVYPATRTFTPTRSSHIGRDT